MDKLLKTQNMNNLKVLCIGDSHFKVSNVKDTELMVASIMKLINSNKPDIIVMMGDTLDRHETVHVSPLTRAVNFLQQMAQICPVYLLIGNHDLINNSQFMTDQHPFNSLKLWPNLKVCDTTFKTTVKGYTFVFVPYVPPGKFNDALYGIVTGDSKDLKDLKGIDAIFCHQEFKGAKMGAIKSEVGDIWPLNAPRVYSGHIHDYDKLQDNITYVGTPIQHTFGDTHRKTISMLEFNGTNVKETRIDLGVPVKCNIQLTINDIDSFKLDPNKEVKLVITGNASELKSASKMTKIKALIAQGVRVVYKEIPDTISKPSNMDNPNEKYLSCLMRACQSDQELKTVFEQIFGSSNNISNNKKIVIVKK